MPAEWLLLFQLLHRPKIAANDIFFVTFSVPQRNVDADQVISYRRSLNQTCTPQFFNQKVQLVYQEIFDKLLILDCLSALISLQKEALIT